MNHEKRSRRSGLHLLIGSLGTVIIAEACSSPFETCSAHRNCPMETPAAGAGGDDAQSHGAPHLGGDGGSGEEFGGAAGVAGVMQGAGTGAAGGSPSVPSGGADSSSAGADAVGGEAAVAGTGTAGAAQGGAGATSSEPDLTCNNGAVCTSSSYCRDGVCEKRKEAGALCSRGEECASDVCGGRCCASATPCSCPQPSPDNLLKNPGFDQDISGWVLDPGAASYAWQPGPDLDKDGCAFSGGLQMTGPDKEEDPAEAQRIWQCVKISPQTNYNYGIGIHGPGVCYLDLYTGDNCTGTSGQSTGVDWINDDWSGSSSGKFNSTTHSSARFSCFETYGNAAFDSAYISRSPSLF
jgi:hypothetical protein